MQRVGRGSGWVSGSDRSVKISLMKIKDLETVASVIKPISKQIELLSQRINANSATWSSNETATRLQLIDPLLREIGWDTANPDHVQPEYRVGSRNADYVLKSDGRPIAVVEAKNLGVKIDADSRLQAHSYVNTPSIKYVIVTNGDRWELYSSTLSDNKPLSKFTVSRDAPHLAAIEAAKISRRVLIESMDFGPAARIREDDSSRGNSLRENVDLRGAQSGTVRDGWQEFDHLEFKGKSPDMMMLPDGERVPTRSWKSIWLTLAEWITERHPVDGEMLFGKNPKYMAIRTENVGFWPGFGEQLANGYWVIGGTVNTSNIRRCSRALLEHCGYDVNTVKFRYN